MGILNGFSRELVASFDDVDVTVLDEALKRGPTSGVEVDETGAAVTFPGKMLDLLFGLTRNGLYVFVLEKNGSPLEFGSLGNLSVYVRGSNSNWCGWHWHGNSMLHPLNYGSCISPELLQERAGEGPYTVMVERASAVAVEC